jgi:hypothetical protein
MSEATLAISFNGDSSEVFSNLLAQFPDYCVKVTPQEGEPFDGILKGSGIESGWYDAIKVQAADKDGFAIEDAEVQILRVKEIHVY